MTDFIMENKMDVLVEELNDNGWTLSNTIIQQLLKKLKGGRISLGEFVYNKMFYGIKTGFNEAYIIDYETKQRLINDPSAAYTIKPFLDGKDIKKYHTPKHKKWLILINNGFTTETFGKLNLDVALNKMTEAYPIIMNWFQSYKSKLVKRSDQGEYWWELRPCAYNNYFEEKKIVWAETSYGSQFCIVEGGVYLNKTTFMIPSDDLALLAILNSKLVEFYLNSIVSKVRGGYFSMSKAYVETIPIVYPENRLPFVKMVEMIMKMKKENLQSDTTSLEDELDQMVYRLYDLSSEEIAIIENAKHMS